ncbi:MAG: 2Fe-2S iron-sulfur cluster binding domain-containing protein [Rhodopirellula sp.]|nr:2Fe-2S iron-sulfur cluster binding domain-containing protein [Rhodopirellula sp.]
MTSDPVVLIDGRELELSPGERLNAIQAAERVGIQIPHYCWHPGLTVVGSCRMCLVEVGTRDAATGEISMMPKLIPGCNTPVRDGMVIVTNSEKVQQARAMVEEDLLLRHPIDCPICDKAGECLLQDYHFQYGRDERRADIRPFTSRRRDIGDVTLFVDRCVMCSRCVRFCREISGTNELMVVNRGAHEEIDVAPGFPLANNLSGNVVDLCPVGALGDKDFLYRQRVWYMRRHMGVCTGCATGCSIWVEENQDRIYRLKPRENPQVNRWWICNEGRYGYPHVHHDQRLAQPLRRDGQVPVDLDWTALPAELLERLRSAGRLAAVLSPYLSVEEAYLLATLVRGIDREARLVLGPVPVVGEDERFPNGFIISSEKCPNRRGVEEIIARFENGRITALDHFLPELADGQIAGVWFSGGYKNANWIEEEKARPLAAVKLLVVQDLFPSAISALATYELPAAAFAERDGSYVNRNDHLQSVRWAIRPPHGVRPEGTLYWEMLGRSGLYNAREVLREIAAEIPYFHAAGAGVPDVGLNLKVNSLAERT